MFYQINICLKLRTKIIKFIGCQNNITNMKDFGFHRESMANILINDIYDGYKSSLRELLTNGVSAIIEAQRKGYIERGKLEIGLVVNDDNTNTLIFKDNGIGMTTELIDNIVSVFGKSKSRDDENRIGQFGIGFMSYFKLNDSFEFVTKSRKTDEVINGTWYIDRFEESDKSIDKDYGTTIKIRVPESKLSSEAIEETLYKYSKYARTTVEFNKYVDDELVKTETYGYNKIEDFYDDPKFKYVLENKYFRAVASEQAEGNLILLDIPVEQYDELNIDGDISIDVRLKKEVDTEVSIDGYKNFKYPKPTGSREEINNGRKFMDHLVKVYEDKIENKFDYSDISGNITYNNIKYNPDDINVNIDLNLLNNESVYVETPFSNPSIVMYGIPNGLRTAKLKKKIGLVNRKYVELDEGDRGVTYNIKPSVSMEEKLS